MLMIVNEIFLIRFSIRTTTIFFLLIYKADKSQLIFESNRFQLHKLLARFEIFTSVKSFSLSPQSAIWMSVKIKINSHFYSLLKISPTVLHKIALLLFLSQNSIFIFCKQNQRIPINYKSEHKIQYKMRNGLMCLMHSQLNGRRRKKNLLPRNKIENVGMHQIYIDRIRGDRGTYFELEKVLWKCDCRMFRG